MKRSYRNASTSVAPSIASAIAMLLLGFSAAPLAAAAPKPAIADKPPTPATHKVAAAPFRVAVKLSGVFETRRTAPISLSPKVWSTLRLVKVVEHGAAVKKGQQLLWLDTEKIDKEIRDRTHGLELWDISLKQAAEELRQLEKTTPEQLARAARDQQRTAEDLQRFTKIGRPLTEKDAAATLKYRRDILEYTREELRQLEKMYKADDLTEETEEIVLTRQRSAVERAELAVEKAEVEHERAMKIALPRQAADFALAKEAKDEALKGAETLLPLALQKKRLEAAKARRDGAVSVEHLAKLKKDRAEMVVKAPIAGVVYYGRAVRGKWTPADTLAAKLSPGSTLSAETVLMTVVDPKALRIRAAAAEKDLHVLAKALPGHAVPTGYPNRKLPLQVASISTVPISPGQFDMQLDVTGKTEPIMPGMTCEVTLVAYENADAISVPAAAVHTDPGDPDQRLVYLKTPGKPQKRIVKVGRSHAGKTEILEGLQEGEVILLKAPK